MKRYNEELGTLEEVVGHLTGLPRRILQHHDLEHLSHIVLHHLSHANCFGLSKAAYFVDNPDFDHLLGAAGYTKDECIFASINDLWQAPDRFHEHMHKTPFHRQIRQVLRSSFKLKHSDLHKEENIIALGKEIGLENPQFFDWEMKHGNHGILIYETISDLDKDLKTLLRDACSILGFCPISHGKIS